MIIICGFSLVFNFRQFYEVNAEVKEDAWDYLMKG